MYQVYYYANGKPIVMRVSLNDDNTDTMNYLHSNHPSSSSGQALGSTSVTTCGNATAPCGTVGSVFARQCYYETR
ncbi:MAG: hypothetical protein ACT4QE_05500 [Anaerolineales bacterium]